MNGNSYYGSTKVEKISGDENASEQIKLRTTPSGRYFKNWNFSFNSQIAKIFFGQNDVLSVSNIDYLCVVCM